MVENERTARVGENKEVDVSKKSLKRQLLDDMRKFADYVGEYIHCKKWEKRIMAFADLIDENFQQIKVSAPIKGKDNARRSRTIYPGWK